MSKAYSIVESLKKHLYRNHRDIFQLSHVQDVIREEEDSTHTWQCSEDDCESVESDLFVAEEDNPIDRFDRAKALFIINIREERHLPQVGLIIYTFIVACALLYSIFEKYVYSIKLYPFRAQLTNFFTM